jgi:hypothetical protein
VGLRQSPRKRMLAPAASDQKYFQPLVPKSVV